jgi:membrane protein DedA with SNARE-associated domain
MAYTCGMSLETPAPSPQDDELYVEAAEVVAERAHNRLERAVIRISGWFGQHRTTRNVVAVTFLVLALTPGFVLFFFPGITDRLAGFGYFSVFVTNLASTATVFIPVPGLTTAAQLLIINEGDRSSVPWLVGVAGGVGMAVGEVTAYYAGLLGSELARGRELPGPKRFHGTIRRVFRAIDWMMDRWGMPTLFVLAAIPNPFFEIAGITAGSVRMPFRRFFVAVLGGKIVRGIMLAYMGQAVPWLLT